MAESHYSADSAPLPPPRLLFKAPSDVIGSGTAPVPDSGTITAAEAFPLTPSSIG
jgi:hypothetical protein